jgi:hypothetical protein
MTRPVPINMFFISGIQVFPVSYKRERIIPLHPYEVVDDLL